MDPADVMELAKAAMWVMLTVAGPMLFASLIVGVAIGLFQALTQIQEVTLTFVPKIIVVFVAMLLLAPFMLHTLTDFTERIMQQAIG